MFPFPLRVFGPAPHLPQPAIRSQALLGDFYSLEIRIPAQNHLFGCSGWCPRAPHERPTSAPRAMGGDRVRVRERVGEKTETLVVFLLDLTPGRSHEAISPPGGGIRGTTSWDGLLAVLGLQQRGGRGRA